MKKDEAKLKETKDKIKIEEKIETKKYIFMGENMTLPEFILMKGTVYYGEKIEKLLKKYPLLEKILVPVEKHNNNPFFYSLTVDEIIGGK